MSPQANGLTTWARRLDWWERILSVCAIPLFAAAAAWMTKVEDRFYDHESRLKALVVEDGHSQADRAKLVESLEDIQKHNMQVIERLARIEAMVKR